MAVVGIAREGPGPHHQPALVGDGNAGLHPEFVRLAGLAFGNALDFRGMQGVELVLVLRLLFAEALGPFQQRVQTGERGGRLSADRGPLAFDLAQDDAQDRAVA